MLFLRRFILFSVTVILALLATELAILLYPDEDLLPEAEQWLHPEEEPVPERENAYFFLMGFFAAQEDDPHTVGLTRVRDFAASIETKTPFTDYPEEKRIEAKFDIEIGDEPLFYALANREAEVLALIESQRHLLRRYEIFTGYSGFQFAGSPHKDCPPTPIEPIKSIYYLRLSQIRMMYEKGDKASAVSALRSDIRFLRKLSASADHIVPKMLLLNFFKQDLHLLGWMLDAEEIPSELSAIVKELHPLTLEERSCLKAFRAEFQAMAYLYSGWEMYGNPPAYIRFLINIFSKRNMTINRTFREYESMAEWSELKAPDFIGEMKYRAYRRGGLWAYARNPLGTALTDLERPSWGGNISRTHAIDGLISLVHLKSAIRSQKPTPDRIPDFLVAQKGKYHDPYTEEPMKWDAEKQFLYFDGGGKYEKLRMDKLKVPFP